MINLPIDKKQRIGLSIGGKSTLDELPFVLERISKFDEIKYVELSLNRTEPIIQGRINKPVLRETKKILSSFPFGYTIHRTNEHDLREVEYIKRNKELYSAFLEYSKEIGASLFVDHFMQKSNDAKIEGLYEESLYKMAEVAENLDIMIGLENIEIEHFDYTIDCIEKLNHPNLKMTFDFGHAFLTSKHFNEDFLGNLKKSKPYLRHIHIHDNTGNFDIDRLSNKQRSLLQRLPHGKGDLHLPIGWGKIPFKEAFEIIGDDYKGIYMFEHDIGKSERFIDEIIKNLFDVI